MRRKFLSDSSAHGLLGAQQGYLAWLLSGWRGLLVLAAGVYAVRRVGLWAVRTS